MRWLVALRAAEVWVSPPGWIPDRGDKKYVWKSRKHSLTRAFVCPTNGALPPGAGIQASMTPDPNFGFEQVADAIIRDVVNTVADLPGLSPEQHGARSQATFRAVMAFQPRDAVEVMLAGQCVIYDHLLHDDVRDARRGGAEDRKLHGLQGTLAIGRVFLATFHTLQRRQKRREDAAATSPGMSRTEARAAASRPAQAIKPLAASPPPAQAVSAKPGVVTEHALPPPSEPPAKPDGAAAFSPRGQERTSGATGLRAQLLGAVSHGAMTAAPGIASDGRTAFAVPRHDAKSKQPAAVGESHRVPPPMIPVAPSGQPASAQAGTASAARTQRAIAPVGEIATGMSSSRQASTA